MPEKISWDDYFMEIARAASKRASCFKKKAGAVLVRNKQILSTGFNGAPKKIQDCFEKGYCMRQKAGIPSGEKLEFCMATHAEQNAIVQAACSGTAINESILYTTVQPCILCAKVIINSGIKEVVFEIPQKDFNKKQPLPESDILAAQLLEEAGIKVRQLKH
jgi:dCMP deaminase